MKRQRIYSWRAVDVEQRLQQGETAGESVHSVRHHLICRHLVPLRIKAGPKLSAKRYRLADRALITRQLAMMLQAGLPLLSSLVLIGKEHPSPQWRYMMNQLHAEVAQGSPFSQALSQHPQAFSTLYCELIRTGELTGKLDVCCLKLAEQLENSAKLRAKVKKALRYPCFILTMTLIVTLLMLTLVLPEFTDVYASFDAPLPYFTQWVIAMSDTVRHYGLYALFALLVLSQWYVTYCHSRPVWQHREQRLMLKIPIVNNLLRAQYLARIFQTLSLTHSAGIVLSEGLAAAANAVHHCLYAQGIMKIKREIEQGNAFYQSVRQSGLFSELSCQLIQVGDESGSLERTLIRLADIYQNEVELLADGLTQTLEPLLMLTLGCIVGSLAIAMYMPIFQLGNIMA